ncbi:MAG: indole-3-glycerol phosphate synthase TrpC [Rhodospirillales bacterium]|nr:indole-3-glycerol phosphate synthase TrpC [Rhodospirillales bacterium]MBT5112745.1 indole-3-glycerol phosphate synthase TrpC [Rhodospirillales bacterium]MBT5673515.1 indole-3-glycerol phosphate synthase TrpC [Rhodospirillales bacterium]MBT6186174.1 indole-3-glycerol phosphate synthase TrpC [Rhodospirillales bacterium]MBT6742001.1 indole-3-glycerol phosphate synthase TrpC [Rhodospirillales bacterium]
MSDILAKICEEKRREVSSRAGTIQASVLADAAKAAPPVRGFKNALAERANAGKYGLIAEIKKASPSAGLIREDFDPATLAKAYEDGGATCLSVLTDTPYFQGRDDYLIAARNACSLPVLRKDFMIDPYQVTEARAIGADCILLIMAVLDDGLAREMADAAASFDMDVLVEVHDEAELERAALLGTGLIGINNRNLRTLKTDIAVTEQLAPLAPKDAILVSESGIRTADDLSRMAAACAGGPRCFLVGESLMRQVDVTQATRELLSQKSSLQKDSDHG